MTKTEGTPHPIKHKAGTPKYNLSIWHSRWLLTSMAQQIATLKARLTDSDCSAEGSSDSDGTEDGINDGSLDSDGINDGSLDSDGMHVGSLDSNGIP